MYIKKYDDFDIVNESYVDEELKNKINAAQTVKEVEDIVTKNRVSKGDLMKIAYNGNTRNIDSAIPREYWKDIDTRWFVMDYQKNSHGTLVNLAEKIIEK